MATENLKKIIKSNCRASANGFS